VIGGTISALVVTFFLLPTVYSVVERHLERRRLAKEGRASGTVPLDPTLDLTLDLTLDPTLARRDAT